MAEHQEQSSKFDELRQQAEALIHKEPAVQPLPATNILDLIHELKIHQAELEIQNEELQRAQQELSQLHQEYETLYEFAPCGYLTLNRKGIITHINLTGVTLLGTDRKLVQCMGFSQFIYPGWEDAFLSARSESGKTGAKKSLELPLKTEHGLPLWVRADIEADRDHAGTVKQWRMVLIDISAQKKTEAALQETRKQLLQSQKLESIGTLAGGIAHDFNNILSSIIGFTELALDDAEKGSSIEDALQEIYTSGKRARDLVKQILTFSRQSDEDMKPIRIATIGKEVLQLLRASIPTSIRIAQNIQQDLMIMGNFTQIHQVLMNLCTNAGHAMEKAGGILEICMKDVLIDKNDIRIDLPPGEYAEIKVSDTGTGIDPEIMDKIFDPYFTTKEIGKGTGMGLALVHGIIESSKGRITVDSKPGQGSVFTIYLPLIRGYGEPPSYQPEPLPTGNERILLVDDEMPIVKMNTKILQNLGYTVVFSTSSMKTLALFRSTPDDFDLVITDMTMPDMTGDQLAVALMKIRQDIPVILCTGYSSKISDKTAARIGIKAFADKPLSKADLAKTVRKVLDAAKNQSFD